MRSQRQSVEAWRRGDSIREFARAVAFANVDLSDRNAEWAIVTRVEEAGPYLQACCYEPFRQEIARALRLSPQSSPAALGFRALRPIYGLTRMGAVVKGQASMRRLLDSIMAGSPDEYIRQMRGFTLDAIAGVSGTGRSMRPGMALNPPFGYPNILYGVALGGELGLWSRLARCGACRRYIYGRTARVVRYCAVPECQALSAKPTGKARTADAAYQRAHRERVRKWARYTRDTQASLRTPGDEMTLTRWETLATRGRKLLAECFKRPTAARAQAIQAVEIAEQRVAFIKISSARRRRPN